MILEADHALIVLAVLAITESAVWLWRLRTGIGSSAIMSAISATLVAWTRFGFLVAGISATMRSDVYRSFVVYGVSVFVATFVAHVVAERFRTRRDAKLSTKSNQT